MHIEIEAGNRHFKSDAFLFESEEMSVTILPPRILVYELQQGETKVNDSFKAYASPDGLYRYAWNFDDSTVKSQGFAQGFDWFDASVSGSPDGFRTPTIEELETLQRLP